MKNKELKKRLELLEKTVYCLCMEYAKLIEMHRSPETIRNAQREAELMRRILKGDDDE